MTTNDDVEQKAINSGNNNKSETEQFLIRTSQQTQLFSTDSSPASPTRSVSKEVRKKIAATWNFNLALCCAVCVLCGSVQFGFSIASLNPITNIIQEFLRTETFLFREYYSKLALFKTNEGYIKGNETRLRDVNKLLFSFIYFWLDLILFDSKLLASNLVICYT